MNQPGLFDSQTPERQVLIDEGGSVVTYHPRFLSKGAADSLFSVLQTSPFRAESPVVAGKAITVTRKACAFGDPGYAYEYSGITQKAHPWPVDLRELLVRLEWQCGARFNFCLANWYPDGSSGLGWHSDKERDLVPMAPIASVSLGAERDFQLRPIGRGPKKTVLLQHGSLLVMDKATQSEWEHQVPKRARVDGARINLTFRVVRSKHG